MPIVPSRVAETALEARQQRLEKRQQRAEAIASGSQALSAAMADAGAAADRAAGDRQRKATAARARASGFAASEGELNAAEKAGILAGAFGVGAPPGGAAPGAGDAQAAWEAIRSAGVSLDDDGTLRGDPSTTERVLGDLGERQSRDGDAAPGLADGAATDTALVPATRGRTPRLLGGAAGRLAQDWVEAADGAIVRTSEVAAALPPELRRFAPQFDDLGQVSAFLDKTGFQDTTTPLGRAEAQRRRDAAADGVDADRKRRRRKANKRRR